MNSREEVWVIDQLEPDLVIEHTPNVERIVTEYRKIKQSIMKKELLRLHKEAQENLEEQIRIEALEFINPALKMRLELLRSRYADATTNLFKILSNQ